MTTRNTLAVTWDMESVQTRRRFVFWTVEKRESVSFNFIAGWVPVWINGEYIGKRDAKGRFMKWTETEHEKSRAASVYLAKALPADILAIRDRKREMKNPFRIVQEG